MKKLLLVMSFFCLSSFAMDHNNLPTINPEAEYNEAEMLEHAKFMGQLYFYQKNELRNKRQEARKKEHLKRKQKQKIKVDNQG